MNATLKKNQEQFDADPENIRAFDALVEHYYFAGEGDDWQQLVTLYQHRLTAPSLVPDNADLRVPVLVRLAQLLEERCFDLDRAIEYYTEAVRLDPSCRQALERMRQIYTGRSQWDLVLQVAELEASQVVDDAEKAAFYTELGDIWQSRMSDHAQALECYQRAVGADATNAGALSGLARALLGMDRPREAVEALERLVEVQAPRDRAPALVELGRLMSDALGELERAEECFRRALTSDPTSEDAVDALVANTRKRGQWELLGELLERQFDLVAGARRRGAIALEAGLHHLQRRRDTATARVWLERAAELCPDDPSIHDGLAELAREIGDNDLLRRSLESLIEYWRESVQPSVLLEAANLQSEAGREERALEYLELARRASPDDPLVLEALSDTLSELRRYNELAEVLQRRIEQTDDPETCNEMLSELGRICSEDLEQPEKAIAAYHRLFETSPQTPGVASRLERLYRQAEQWTEMRALLESAALHGPVQKRPSFWTSLGEILAAHFDDPRGATGAYEAALDLDPAKSRALEGLQRLALDSGDGDALCLAYEREAASCADATRLGFLVAELSRHYQSAGRPADALRWVERLIEIAPDDCSAHQTAAALHEQQGDSASQIASLERLGTLLEGSARSENLHRLADLHFDGERFDEAVSCWEAALELDPADQAALRSLEPHYREAGRLGDLESVLRTLAGGSSDAEKSRALDALARLRADELDDPHGAIEALEQLSACAEGRPDDFDDRLAKLLERTERFDGLVSHLAARSHALGDDFATRRALDLQRAELLLDPLERVQEAVTVLQEVRSYDPDSGRAIELLESALRRAGDTAGLTALLEEQEALATQPQTRARMRFERAVLLDDVLQDGAGARALYETLVDDQDALEHAAEASARLAQLLARVGDWSALRALLEDQMRAADFDERLSLHRRVANLCREHLDDLDGCVEHLEAMGDLQPDDVQTWRQLGALYETLEQPFDHARVAENELALGPDPDRERNLRAVLARLARRRDDLEATRSHYERLLELEPGHGEACEFLIDHYEASDASEDVVRLLLQRLESGAGDDADGSGRTALQLRIAALQSGRLGDPEKAIATLEQTRAERGTPAMVAEPLAELYTRCGRSDELVDLCEAAAECAPDDAERAGWRVRLAQSLRDRGDEASLARAADAYRTVLAHRGEDPETEEALRELYRTLGDARALCEMLQRHLPRVDGESARAVRLEIADLLAGPLDRPAEALCQLQELLAEAPTEAEAFGRAIELAERQGAHDALVELIDIRLSLDLDDEARSEALERKGDLLAGPAGRLEDALYAYREASALAPRRPEPRAAVCRVLESLERWKELLDRLQLEASDASAESRGELLRRGLEIARLHLADDDVLPWLERMRADHPDDVSILEQIADLHRRAGRPQALLRVLDAQRDQTPDRARQCAILRETARVLEGDLLSPARATAPLEAALALDPENGEILGDLERLYTQLDRPLEHARVLGALLALQDEGSDTTPRHAQLAGLFDGLGEPARALPHWLHTVSGTPDRDPAKSEHLRALCADLVALGETEAANRARKAELALLDPDDAQTARRRAELHRDLARAYSLHTASRSAALEHGRALASLLDDALAEDETWTETRREAVRDELLALLRAERNFVELEARLAAKLGGSEEDRPGRCDEWLELARLRDEKLHQPAAAAEAYRAVLESDPQNLAAVRGLRQVSERLEDWPEVARTLQLELDGPDSQADRGTLMRKLGDIALNRLHDGEWAKRTYKAALEIDGFDFASLRALQHVSESCESWADALDYYGREIELLDGNDPVRTQQVWLRIGDLERQQTSGDAHRALEAYERAAALGDLFSHCHAFTAERRHEWAQLYRETGQSDRYAEIHGSWCDDPESNAGSHHHLELAAYLEELGRTEDALARARKALEVARDNATAWDTVARLHEAQGEPAPAAQALEHAAEILAGSDGAERLLCGAALLEDTDPEGAIVLVRRATELDAASAPALARLARLAERLSELEEAEDAAGRALDLDASARNLDDIERLQCALTGGRAARQLERLEAAARYFAQALDAEPDHREALEEQGEVLFLRGDLTSARHVLEKRLALPGDNPQRAHHLAMVAAGLEVADQMDEALARFEEALAVDPALDEAHAGIARLHETAGRIDKAIAAIDEWVAASREPATRAAQLLRAARLAKARGESDRAEQRLRDAVAADPGCEGAHVALADLLWDADRVDDALEAATEGLDHCESDESRAPLALMRARALDARDQEALAAEAFGEARRRDPTCVEAALAEARLLRAVGQWQAAADGLLEFAERHPDPGSAPLAQVHYERARLLAGPLESAREAIAGYERAVAIEPSFIEAREPLASLLCHFPEEWPKAIEHHTALLIEHPLRAASLRALVDIARERSSELTSSGLAILRGLGVSTAEEQRDAPRALSVRAGEPAELADPLYEKLRQLAELTAAELTRTVLPSPAVSEPTWRDEANAGFWRTKREAERHLTSPAIADVPTEELSDTFYALAALALDPNALPSTGPARAMEQAVGRWTRRKLRKILEGVELSDVSGVDFAAWRFELDVLAAAVAVDRCDGDLRTALVTLLIADTGDPGVDTGETADLTTALERSPVAIALMGRIVHAWTEALSRRVRS